MQCMVIGYCVDLFRDMAPKIGNCRDFTKDRLMSHPVGVNDSDLLSATVHF